MKHRCNIQNVAVAHGRESLPVYLDHIVHSTIHPTDRCNSIHSTSSDGHFSHSSPMHIAIGKAGLVSLTAKVGASRFNVAFAMTKALSVV